MKLPISLILLFLTICSKCFLSQNTITVKKNIQIEGLYVGESYLEDDKSNGFKYIWFSKSGNACLGSFKRKKKIHAFKVKECAENGNYCNNLNMFNYKINDSFGDKGLSPYLHIEFYEIVANDSTKINSDQIIFSRCSAELEGKTLHFKCNESFMNSGVYQLYFEED